MRNYIGLSPEMDKTEVRLFIVNRNDCGTFMVT